MSFSKLGFGQVFGRIFSRFFCLLNRHPEGQAEQGVERRQPGQDQPEEKDLRARQEDDDGGQVPSDGVEAEDPGQGGEAGEGGVLPMQGGGALGQVRSVDHGSLLGICDH